MAQPPLTFKPAFFQRIWGGRQLATQFGRELPNDGQPYGESWEISDRPELSSEVAAGPCKGKTLHELWTGSREELFGKGYDHFPQFPLLCKILDAQDKLSIQVHPPALIAKSLGGDSKTEAWYIAEAAPGASLYSGWEKPVTSSEIAASVADGTLHTLIHELFPKKGEALFLPSGRVHALGAGLVVFEIQENSDTTYRLYDWNRTDAEGNPRELHVENALKSLDLEDIRPEMLPASGGTIADSPEFLLEQFDLKEGDPLPVEDASRFTLFVVAEGSLQFKDMILTRGTFFIVPVQGETGEALPQTRVLRCTVPPVL